MNDRVKKCMKTLVEVPQGMIQLRSIKYKREYSIKMELRGIVHEDVVSFGSGYDVLMDFCEQVKKIYVP
jgi:hypothetical protein